MLLLSRVSAVSVNYVLERRLFVSNGLQKYNSFCILQTLLELFFKNPLLKELDFFKRVAKIMLHVSIFQTFMRNFYKFQHSSTFTELTVVYGAANVPLTLVLASAKHNYYPIIDLNS